KQIMPKRWRARLPHPSLYACRWLANLIMRSKKILIMKSPNNQQIAEQVRQACIEAARQSFKNASMSGLCAEGAAEAAIGAIQALDLAAVIAEAQQSG